MLDLQISLIIALTFLINLIGSLAYSVRIAGIRTRRIAVSFSMFNILMLISRTANAFQAPLLAKRIETNLIAGATVGALIDFRFLLASASVATIVGALMTPTCQRLFARAASAFNVTRSVPRLVLRACSPAGLAHVRDALTLPAAGNVTALADMKTVSMPVIAVNVIATATWTVGVFAAMYAGYLAPELRATASNLSGIINGISTILLFVIVDPYLSTLTDDVVDGRASEAAFRRTVVWLLGSRLAGTLLAQVVLVPAAHIIAGAAQFL